LDRLADLLDARTRLLSLAWVNNETGVITDVQRAVQLARGRGVARVHLDAAQAWGKLPIRLADLDADYVSFSGHKIGGLAGSGALWTQVGAPYAGLLPGKQEGGRRGGTENLLGAVALGAAASELDPLAWAAELAPVREALERAVKQSVPGTRVHGEGAPRVANTSNFGFEGLGRAGLVAALDLAGYAVSAGSACSSGVPEPSRTLRAMGLDAGAASGGLRVSLGKSHATAPREGGTLKGDPDWIAGFVTALGTAVAKLTKIGG
jgi:cysteine desulfurase